MKKKKICLLIIISSISMFFYYQVIAADDLEFIWLKNDTLNNELEIVNNKAADDELLLKWNLNKQGEYILSYFLKDDAETIISITNNNDEINVKYGLEKESNGDTYLSQGYVDTKYSEIDFSEQSHELKSASKTVSGNDTLDYTITQGNYQGIVFQIDQTLVKMKWEGSTFYVYTNNVDKGKIIPVSLTEPTDMGPPVVETKNILRALDGFTVSPSHWKDDDNNLNTEIEIPGDDELGGRPGMTITYNQPQVYDNTLYQFVTNTDVDDVKAKITVEDVTNQQNTTDVTVYFNQVNNDEIEIPVDGEGQQIDDTAQYQYVGNTYTIELVKDETGLTDTSFLAWDELEGSKIYNISISMYPKDGYEFATYTPENHYGYTFLEYEISRADLETAYLNIKPYAGTEDIDVEYNIYHGDTSIDHNNDLWLTHYYNSSQGDTNMFIPIPFSKGKSDELYQVGVKFADGDLYSQTVKYYSNQDTDVPPPTPRISSIDNLSVIPSLDVNNEAEKIQFDLAFEAPTNTAENPILDDMLDGGTIYYEIYINDQPNETESNKYELIDVVKAEKDGDDIVLKNLDGGKEYEYDNENKLFKVDNIILKEKDEDFISVKDETDPPTYPEKLISASVTYPGVNFLKIRALYDTGAVQSTSEMSVPSGISLDAINYDIPIPANLKSTATVDTSKTIVTFDWSSIDLSNYENYMLAPLNKNIDNYKYRLMISEQKENISTVNMDAAQSIAYTPGQPLDMTTVLSNLRNNEVVYTDIDTPNLSLEMENLDQNKTYYVRMYAIVNIKDGANTTEEKSEYSEIDSVTVPIIPEDPTNETLLPIAPNDFNVSFVEGSESEVELTWEYPETLDFENETHGFEIIGLKDRDLPDNLLEKGLSITSVIESLEDMGEEVIAYKLSKDTVADEYILLKYNSETKTFESSTQLVQVLDHTITIKEEGLTSNSIYYFNVRTTNLSGDTGLTSSWVVDTVTTQPIQPPINLIIPSSPPYSYDAKTETIIQFDAPIKEDASIGSDYDIEVYVKGEDDTDYSNTKYSSEYLGKESETVNGNVRLYFKVEDLKPGKAYNIKVLIEDKTKEPEQISDDTVSYPKSNFSEIVTTRTEFDQAANDKEEKYKQYEEYYESQLEELKKLQYWLVDTNDDSFEAKYRNSVISSSEYKNKTFTLTADKNKDTYIYYLPSEMIENLNQSNTTIQLEVDGIKVALRPKTISESLTEEIKSIKEKIKQLDSTYTDYYIEFQVTKGSYNGTINGYNPFSDVIDVSLKVVPSTITEEKLEQQIIERIDYLGNTYKDTLYSLLDNELEKGINDEKLNEIVKSVIKMVKTDHKENVETYLDDALMTPSTISSVSNPVFISWETSESGYNVTTYYKNYGIWEKVDLTYNMNQYFTNASKLGSYILVSQDNLITSSFDEPSLNMINKYELGDFFMVSELSDKSIKPSKYQITNSVARLLGASKGKDAISFLKEQGFTFVNSINTYSQMRTDEAYYLVLKAYEKRKNIQLDRIKIYNYNAIKDSTKIKAKYKKIILAGAQLNLFDNSNYINPDSSITLEQLFKILQNIQ